MDFAKFYPTPILLSSFLPFPLQPVLFRPPNLRISHTFQNLGQWGSYASPSPPLFPWAEGPSELLNQVWWFSILVGCQVEARMSLINNLSSTHWQEVGNSSSDGRQIVDDKKKNKHTNRKRPRCHNFSPFFLTIQRSGFFLTRRLLRRISRLLVNQIIACLKRDF